MSPIATQRLVRVAAAVVLGVAVGVGARYWLVDDAALAPQLMTIGGPFTLTDHNGQRRTQADFRGKPMLIAFGYTSCPDVCPLELQLMTDALAKLGPAGQAIQPVFVTVDPGRDTVAKMKDYVGHFSPRFIGLTGTDAEIAAAAKAFRIYYKLHGDPAKDRDYLVDHTAFIYLMGRDGAFITHFTPDTSADKMADALRQYL